MERARTGRWKLDLLERFAEKCVRSGDCWLWTGHVVRDGRGQIWLDGRMVIAHRLAYELFVGEIPEDWVVRQTCGNKLCMNPEHLEAAVTKRMRRRESAATLEDFYADPRWRSARAAARKRDGNRCTAGWLFGGECTDRLHVHHIVPLREGGEPFDLRNLGTVCSRHHKMWEALRHRVLDELTQEQRDTFRCPHRHTSPQARELCERRRARRARQLSEAA